MTIVEIIKSKLLLSFYCQSDVKVMSKRFHLASKAERELFDFLEKGPLSTRQHNEIIMEMKRHGISERTTNRMLKENLNKRVFRIKKNGMVFYRLNDFPPEVLVFFASIDSLNDNSTAAILYNQVKRNIIELYGKMPLQQILNLWRLKLNALRNRDKTTLKLIEKFEESMK